MKSSNAPLVPVTLFLFRFVHLVSIKRALGILIPSYPETSSLRVRKRGKIAIVHSSSECEPRATNDSRAKHSQDRPKKPTTALREIHREIRETAEVHKNGRFVGRPSVGRRTELNYATWHDEYARHFFQAVSSGWTTRRDATIY